MEQAPTHLDLFSGIGGFALAAQWAGFRTIGFCEIDGYCRKVLAKNFLADSNSGQHIEPKRSIQAGWDAANGSDPRIHSDIFDLDGTAYRGVSLITGGFPCQPFSVAGKRGGAADDRAIWPQMFRVISEARPTWLLGENVPGIIPMELDNVLSDLEGIGYSTRAFVIPACAVDARHRRDRVWIVGRNMGQSISEGLEGCQSSGHMELQGGTQSSGSVGATGAAVADTNERGFAWGREPNGGRCESGWSECACRWLPEPGVCRVAVRLPGELDCYRYEPEWEGVPRVATGVKDRVNRLRSLGNSIQSQVAYEILREIRRLI